MVGRDDRLAKHVDLINPPELLAWHTETSAEFTLRTFPGDHFYLRGGRPDVLSAIRQDLSRANAARAPFDRNYLPVR